MEGGVNIMTNIMVTDDIEATKMSY